MESSSGQMFQNNSWNSFLPEEKLLDTAKPFSESECLMAIHPSSSCPRQISERLALWKSNSRSNRVSIYGHIWKVCHTFQIVFSSTILGVKSFLSWKEFWRLYGWKRYNMSGILLTYFSLLYFMGRPTPSLSHFLRHMSTFRFLQHECKKKI